MKKTAIFTVRLVKSIITDDILTHANELTYKLLLSFFPFIIFIMSLLGFLNIDSDYFLTNITSGLPDAVSGIVNVFTDEVIDVRHAGLLSGSLFLTVFTSSSGFNAAIKGITKAYGTKETRNIFVVRFVSICLVLVLTVALLVSFLILIFGDQIYNTLNQNFTLPSAFVFIFGLAGNLLAMIILLFTIIAVYKFATCKRLTVYEVFPGAFVTLIIWVISSKLFNIYINNFARYSMIYGSIAGIIILLLWLNIISIVLLIGGEINAILISSREGAELKADEYA